MLLLLETEEPADKETQASRAKPLEMMAGLRVLRRSLLSVEAADLVAVLQTDFQAEEGLQRAG